jgi:hypothetical protein
VWVSLTSPQEKPSRTGSATELIFHILQLEEEMIKAFARPFCKHEGILIRTLLICLLFCLVTSLFYVLLSHKLDLVSVDQSDIYISDFAYHINLFKEFWFGGLDGIYDPDSQMLALTRLTGKEAHRAILVGVTPIATLVWFPFSIVALFDLLLADALWVTVSLAVLLWGIWRLETAAYGGSAGAFSLPAFTLKMILFLSSAMTGAILQAQFSVFASGALLLLLSVMVDEKTVKPRYRILVISLLLLFLAIKPTYFVLGSGLVLIFGQFSSFMGALTVASATLGLLSLKMGIRWPIDYYRTLRLYSSDPFPSFYQDIHLETMNTFSGAFENLIGRSQALFVSNIISMLGVVVIISLGVMASGRFPVSMRFPSDRKFKLCLFIALIGMILLFSPILGSYEDILLVAAFGSALMSDVKYRFGAFSSIYFITAAFALNFSRFALGCPLWPFWLAKAILLIMTLISIDRSVHSATKLGPSGLCLKPNCATSFNRTVIQ